MKDAYQTFKGKKINTQSFQLIVEKHLRMDMGWFFKQWIYGRGYPIYHFSWSFQEVGEEFVTDLTIEQIQKDYGAEEVFTMPLDIMIMSIPGPVRDTVQVWNNQRIQSYQFTTDRKPGSIVLDPSDWVLHDSERVAAIDSDDESLPLTYKLEQNYPNPFNPSTSIRFILPEKGEVSLRIYNVQGKLVEQLLKTNLSAGEHNIIWNAENISSGVYYYQIKAGSFQAVKKCVLMK